MKDQFAKPTRTKNDETRQETEPKNTTPTPSRTVGGRRTVDGRPSLDKRHPGRRRQTTPHPRNAPLPSTSPVHPRHPSPPSSHPIPSPRTHAHNRRASHPRPTSTSKHPMATQLPNITDKPLTTFPIPSKEGGARREGLNSDARDTRTGWAGAEGSAARWHREDRNFETREEISKKRKGERGSRNGRTEEQRYDAKHDPQEPPHCANPTHHRPLSISYLYPPPTLPRLSTRVWVRGTW
jgi:hypothetical protein